MLLPFIVFFWNPWKNNIWKLVTGVNKVKLD